MTHLDDQVPFVPAQSINAGATASAAADEDTFDFDTHKSRAVDSYQQVRGQYADFAAAVESILRTCLSAEAVNVHSITHRAKTIESFGRKALKPAEGNPSRPKYEQPLDQITDLAGVRVITFFLSTVGRVDPIVHDQFDVLEKTNRTELLKEEEKLGYQSVHYLVRLRENRCALPEYSRFRGLQAEIQVRTILQHTWAEIEHDIQYKARHALPSSIRRRFMTLAGLIEIADREFQAIEEEDARLRSQARQSVAEGRLSDVEVTPDALRAYLDQRFGVDGRMTNFSYYMTANLLAELGFHNLGDVDSAVGTYDDDTISRAVHGSRQGQISRFELVLQAAMGEEYCRRHPWARSSPEWFPHYCAKHLSAIREAGIPVGQYLPPS